MVFAKLILVSRRKYNLNTLILIGGCIFYLFSNKCLQEQITMLLLIYQVEQGEMHNDEEGKKNKIQ